MQKPFIAVITSVKTSFELTIHGTHSGQTHLLKSLPGLQKSKQLAQYILTFGYLHGEELGYKKRLLFSEDEMQECVHKLTASR